MRILVTGANGQLGAYVLPALLKSGHEVVAWSGSRPGEMAGVVFAPVDLFRGAAIPDALDAVEPEAILHLAAVSAVDAVRDDPVRARAINVEATRILADWCGLRDCRLVFTSTDLVFDGRLGRYRESDHAQPTLAYGRTKVDAEHEVTSVPRGLVVRIPLQFGTSRCGRESPVDRALATLRRGEPITVFADEYRTPLDYATTARGLVELLELDRAGVVHLAGPERVSRHELMTRIAAASGIDPGLVRGNLQAEVTFPEPRPADVSLDTGRLGRWLPDFRRPAIEEAAAGW